MKLSTVAGYEPEVGDEVEGRKITAVLRYSHSGQVWYVRCDDGLVRCIEDSIYDPGPIHWKFT